MPRPGPFPHRFTRLTNSTIYERENNEHWKRDVRHVRRQGRRAGLSRPTCARIYRLGREVVPGFLHLRGGRGGDRRGRRDDQWRRTDGGFQTIRPRLLEHHSVHDADGLRRHHRLRRRQLPACSAPDRPTCHRPDDGSWSRRVRRPHLDPRLDAELGSQPRLRQPLGEGARGPHGAADGLSRRRRRRLSRPRRHLGARSVVLGRAAACEPHFAAARAVQDGGHHPVHRDDLHVAVDRDVRGAADHLGGDRLGVGAGRQQGRDRAGHEHRRRVQVDGLAAA